jgi:hypothetical protein
MAGAGIGPPSRTVSQPPIANARVSLISNDNNKKKQNTKHNEQQYEKKPKKKTNDNMTLTVDDMITKFPTK